MPGKEILFLSIRGFQLQDKVSIMALKAQPNRIPDRHRRVYQLVNSADSSWKVQIIRRIFSKFSNFTGDLIIF
jgi:hypothetical protein